jgi:acetyltransferase-like isoleucine patch superfamily enzyme
VKRYWYDDTARVLGKWRGVNSRPRLVFNAVMLSLCNYLPFMGLKVRMLRRLGMRIGEHVLIYSHVAFDAVYPELIEIGDRVVLGYGTTILTHEFLVNEFRKGPVRIGSDSMVGALSLVLPGVDIGEGSIVGAYSLVNRDVGAGEFAAGVPVKTIRMLK